MGPAFAGDEVIATLVQVRVDQRFCRKTDFSGGCLSVVSFGLTSPNKRNMNKKGNASFSYTQDLIALGCNRLVHTAQWAHISGLVAYAGKSQTFNNASS